MTKKDREIGMADAAIANVAQGELWNDAMGKTWALMHERLDRQIGPVGRAAMAKAGFKPGERVLDVGCGCGETSFEIAKAIGPAGSVTAADISALLLDIAREHAKTAGLDNLAFVQADAQVHAFPPAAFDVLFSRFGVMFFEDPTAAFTNLRRALKPGGRLAFACWRSPRENLWLSLPMQSAQHLLPPQPPPDPTAPGPFAFADGERVRGIVQTAGFSNVAVEPLDLELGADSLEQSVDQAFRIGPLGSALRESNASDELKDSVKTALQEALAPHVRNGVVKLPAAVWIVSARN